MEDLPEGLEEPFERLKWAREHRGRFKWASEAARALGVPESTYRAYEAGTRKFDRPTAEHFGRRFRVPAVWLLGFPASEVGDANQNVHPAANGERHIPVISSIQAGKMSEISDPYAVGDGEDVVSVTNAHDVGLRAFALEVEGESMIAKPQSGEFPYYPGDTIVVDPDAALSPGCLVVAKTADSSMATFKKYRPRGADANGAEIIDLAPLNDDWPSIRIDAAHPGVIIGRVVRHIRRP